MWKTNIRLARNKLINPKILGTKLATKTEHLQNLIEQSKKLTPKES